MPSNPSFAGYSAWALHRLPDRLAEMVQAKRGGSSNRWRAAFFGRSDLDDDSSWESGGSGTADDLHFVSIESLVSDYVSAIGTNIEEVNRIDRDHEAIL
jgi:hypothetical protein